MEQFVYLIRPKRDDFIDSMTQKESEIMEDHFEYLNNLLSEKRLILAGPCLDGSFGIVVFEAESEEAANNIMNNDPSVLEGVMSAELHPYRVSLMQNI